MRRQAPTLPISPQQLKHFALLTVAMTGLLALFASGENWGAQAQVGAREAKNELITTESEKLGTRKVAATLKIRDSGMGSGFGDDSGGDGGFASGGGSGGGGGRSASATGMPIPQKSGPSFLPPPGLQARPGAAISKTGMVKPHNEATQGDGAETESSQPGASPRPDGGTIEAMKEASRQRSGSAGANGD